MPIFRWLQSLELSSRTGRYCLLECGDTTWAVYSTASHHTNLHCIIPYIIWKTVMGDIWHVWSQCREGNHFPLLQTVPPERVSLQQLCVRWLNASVPSYPPQPPPPPSIHQSLWSLWAFDHCNTAHVHKVIFKHLTQLFFVRISILVSLWLKTSGLPQMREGHIQSHLSNMEILLRFITALTNQPVKLWKLND